MPDVSETNSYGKKLECKMKKKTCLLKTNFLVLNVCYQIRQHVKLEVLQNVFKKVKLLNTPPKYLLDIFN